MMTMDLHSRVVSTTDAAGQVLRSPGLDPVANGNQIQERMDWDQRQQNR